MITYSNSNNLYLENVLYKDGFKPCKLKCIGEYMDNLHLDFLKQYNYIPKGSVTCCNSMSLYQVIN